MNWRISSPQASFSYQYPGFSSPRESTYLIRRGKRGGRWVGLGFPLPSFPFLLFSPGWRGKNFFSRSVRGVLPLGDPVPLHQQKKKGRFLFEDFGNFSLFSSANHKSGLPPVSPTFFACSIPSRRKKLGQKVISPHIFRPYAPVSVFYFFGRYIPKITHVLRY